MSERERLGTNRTRQREGIARVLREAGGPLGVHEILERARREVPGLGLVTVYRTLGLLREAGQLRAVVLPSGESRYEPEGRGHHHHFHCRRCDTVYDLPGCPLRVPEGGEVAPGFRSEGHDLTFSGTCPACGTA
jgi:Fur family transcriptional regulator, ferric uptake regulator